MAQRRAGNLGWHQNVTRALRKRATDPEFRLKFLAGREKMKQNPEWQAKQDARNRKMPENPVWRAKNRAHLDSLEGPSKAERHIAEALEPLGFIFRGNQSAHLWCRFDQASKDAGIPPTEPHKLRRSVSGFATRVGCRSEFRQRRLGHTS